jgi:hypothetical protein
VPRLQSDVAQGFRDRLARLRVPAARAARFDRFGPLRAVAATALARVFLASAVGLFVHVAPRRHEHTAPGHVAQGRAVGVADVDVQALGTIGEGQGLDAEPVEPRGTEFQRVVGPGAMVGEDPADCGERFGRVASQADLKERIPRKWRVDRRSGAGRLCSHGKLQCVSGVCLGSGRR